MIDWSHPLAKGLVGCWLMNEGGGSRVNDLSGNGKTGTLKGDVIWMPGRHGPALYFPGSNDYVALGGASDVIGTSDFTILVWVNLPSNATGRAIYSKGTTGDGDILVYRHGGGTTLQLYADAGLLSVSATYVADTWACFVVVRSGAKGYAYLNGVLTSTDADCAGCDITDADTNWAIGGSEGGTSSDYLGYISEVTRWNRALTASEVAQLYYDSFAMFQQPRPELYVAAAAPAGGVSQVIIVSKAAVPVLIPLCVIFSMALVMRKPQRDSKHTTIENSRNCT